MYAEQFKSKIKARGVSKQSEFDIKQMDDFVAELDVQEASHLTPFIQEYLQQHGEKLVNLRDSTGNCLIHHLCMKIKDSEVNEFAECLEFLLSNSGTDENPNDDSLACMNFLRGIPISMGYTQENLQELGLNPNNNKITVVLKVNSGNSFGQTPLHLLASMKKTNLLMKFLDIVFKSQPELISFNPNVHESTNRTFIHILLEKAMLDTYEEVAIKYGAYINLQHKDMHDNSALMLYKTLKRAQLDKLKKAQEYKLLVECINRADLQAFGDVRNLIFDRELGTNILSDLVKNETASDFLTLLVELRNIKNLQDFEKVLINLPNVDGTPITFKVFQLFNFPNIQKFIDIVGLQSITYFINTKTDVNMYHLIMENHNLTLEQKLKITTVLNQKHLFNKIDYQGNFPINYLIQNLKIDQKINAVEIKHLLEQTDIKELINYDKIQEEHKISEEQKRTLAETRKEIAEKMEVYKGKGAKKIKELKMRENHRVSKYEKKQIIQKVQSYHTMVTRQSQIINPLECAIKRNQIEISRILIEDFEISTMLPTSDHTQTLLELSATHSDLRIFKIAVRKIDEKQFSFVVNPITMLLNLDRRMLSHKLNNQAQEFEEDYSLILGVAEKIGFETLLKQQMKGDDYKTVSSDTIIKELINKMKISKQKSMIANLLSNELLESISHITHLCILCTRFRNYQLLSKIISHLEWTENSEENLSYLYYRLFKESLSRNDYEGFKQLITIIPKGLGIIKNNDTFRQKLGKAMFRGFKDFYDFDTIKKLRDNHGLIIIPKISEDSLKRQRDERYSALPPSIQKEIIQKSHLIAFQHVVELIKNDHHLKKEDQKELSDVFLESKNKHQYLIQLAESEILFKILDIRWPEQSKTINEFIRTCIKLGNLDATLKVLSQMKKWIIENCSSYPVDYYAELQQFERNYPYREFKIDGFIRMVNYKSDVYPTYLGTQDIGEIDDDHETLLGEVWEKLILHKGPLECKTSNKKDVYIPNGGALIFKMFATSKANQLSVTDKNFEQVKQLFNYVFEFGGFPLLEITNIKEMRTLNQNQQDYIYKQHKTLSKFNQCIMSQKFQNILHQMALDYNFDQQMLQSLTTKNSLSYEAFNSRDSTGRSPVMLAIEHKNFKFLDIAINNNSSIFIKDDIQFTKIIQRYFEDSTVEQQIQLIQYLSINISKINETNKQLLLSNNLKNINDLLDVVYASSSEMVGRQMEELQERITGQLKTGITIIEGYNRQILEVLKLRRSQIQEKVDKKDIDGQIIQGKLLSPSFITGSLLTSMGTNITIEQLKQLEKCGIDISNMITLTFSNHDNLKKKITPLPAYFPFPSAGFHLSYLLKNILLVQPKNSELINYVFKKMNLELWKPFLFEIMVFVGKILGTKHEIFSNLFNKEQAHLMGRLLTVESRIKSFSESYIPNAATLYYKDEAYKQMIVKLLEILIENDELQMFIKLINDQSRFFFTQEMIVKGLETCCRHFRPKMALLLISVGIKEDLTGKFNDFSNLMPCPTAEVTMKEVQQINYIVRSLDNKFSALSFFKKVIYINSFVNVAQISREMMDDLMQLIFEHDQLYLLFNINDKETKENQFNIFTEIYHKASPKIVIQLVHKLKQQCDSDKTLLRLYKFITKQPSKAIQSISKTQFSHNHKQYRRMEMKTYLMNKIDTFAVEPSYYKLINDKSLQDDLIDYLGITEKDLLELRERAQVIHDQEVKIQGKKFVYGEFQTLLGVYKLYNKDKRPNRKQPQQLPNVSISEIDSIKEMEKFSETEIKEMTIDDLKSKSENLILLYEYLVRQDQRRNNHSTKDNRSYTITHQELRELIFMSQPNTINLGTLFSQNDVMSNQQYLTLIVVQNEFEDIIAAEKFQETMKDIDLTQYNQKQLKSLIDTLLYRNSNPSGFYTLDLFSRVAQQLHELTVEFFRLDQEQNEDEQNEQVTSYWVNIKDCLFNLFKENHKYYDNPYKRKQLSKILQQIMSIDTLIDYLRINFNIENNNDLFGTFPGILLNPLYYKELRSTFVSQLVNNIETSFSFVFEENFNLFKVLAFYSQYLPIFNQDDEEFHKKLIHNETFMSKIPEIPLKMIFAMLCSKDKKHKYVDDLIKKLAPFMAEFDNLVHINRNNVRPEIYIRDEGSNKYKYTAPEFTIQDFQNTMQRVSTIFDYLIRNKRSKLALELMDQLQTENNSLITILMFAPDNKELIKTFIEKKEINLSEVQRLFSRLLINSDEELLNYMNQLAHGKLLEYELQQINDNKDNELRKYDGLLHDLITQKNYDKIYLIKKYATAEQWKHIKYEYKQYAEQEATEDDLIMPFTLALVNHQFDLCEYLMPEETSAFSSFTKTEQDIVNQFVNEYQIVTYDRYDKQTNQLLLEFEQLALNKVKPLQKENVKADKFGNKRIDDFQITKKLLIFPSLLKLIYNCQDKEQSMFLYDNSQLIALRDIQRNPIIDSFLANCGLIKHVNKIVINQLLKEEHIFYVLEHGFDLEEYFNQKNPNVRNNLITKPYTTLVGMGLIKEIEHDQKLQNLLMNKKIMELQKELKSLITQTNQESLDHLFKEASVIFNDGMNNNQFCLTYYLLLVQSNYGLMQDLDIQKIKSYLWNLHFDTFSQDLIIIQAIKNLFKDDSLFSVSIGCNVFQDQGVLTTIFYDKDNKTPIPSNFNGRQVALLLALFNQFQQYQFNHYAYDKDDKQDNGLLDEPTDFTPQTMLKTFLLSSQKYLLKKETKDLMFKDFVIATNYLTLLKEGIEQFDSAINGDRSEVKQLSQKLNINLENNVFNSQFTDDQLLELIISLANFDAIEYREYLDFKLFFDPHDIDLKVTSSKYSKSLKTCIFVTQTFPDLLKKMSSIIGGYCDTYLEIHLTKQENKSFQKFNEDESRYRLNLSYNHINDDNAIQQISQMINHHDNLLIIKKFIHGSSAQIKENMKVKEVEIKELEILNDLTVEEANDATQIIQLKKIYKDKKTQFSLYDIINGKLNEILPEKRVKELEFAGIEVELVRTQDIYEDLINNYDENLEKAEAVDEISELTLKVQIAFDSNKKDIIINEGAFVPYVVLANRNLCKQMNNNMQFYEVRSKFFEIPKVKFNLVSLYRNVIKHIKNEEKPGFNNTPYKIAQHFFMNNQQLLSLMMTAIENLAEKYRVLMDDKILKHDEYRPYHSTFNLLRMIEISFDLDHSKIEEPQEGQILYVTDVKYSTKYIRYTDWTGNEDFGEEDRDIEELKDREIYIKPEKERDIWSGLKLQKTQDPFTDQIEYPLSKDSLLGRIQLMITIKQE